MGKVALRNRSVRLVELHSETELYKRRLQTRFNQLTLDRVGMNKLVGFRRELTRASIAMRDFPEWVSRSWEHLLARVWRLGLSRFD